MLGLDLSLTSSAVHMRRDGVWVPSDLGSVLNSHWTADDHGTSNMTDDGSGLISAWKARVSAVNPIAVTTARPTWTSTAFNTLYTGMTFDGTTDVIGTATGVSGLITGATAGYIFTVVDQTALVADTGQRTIGGYGATGAGGGRFLLRTVTSGANRLRISTGTAAPLDDVSVDFSSRHMVLAGFAASGVISGWIDGAVTSPATSATTVPNTGTSRVRLGASINTSADLFWQGVIRHFMVLTGALTAVDIDKLFGWAAWDGGLRANLPASHPYKSVRP